MTTMAQLQHPRTRLTLSALLLLLLIQAGDGRSSQISDLKSKISGVEELLEQFRQQLQQDQTLRAADASDTCVGEFSASPGRIIRTRVSIEQGAAFLLAPEPVSGWAECAHTCCSLPHCTVAVMQEERRGCYLFNCTYRGRNVCSFAPQPGFSAYTRANTSTGHGPAPAARSGDEGDEDPQEVDEPPRSDAGQDVVIQLPTDWAVLDGRDSVDDHSINRYEWTLVKGDTAISMKATHPGLLKVSGLQEGVYTFQMTVTDSAGQKSSDNVSITVLAPKHRAEVCTGHCSNYQFKCDDGCCIDITFACDGKQHCPDRSDEDFCPNFDSGRKSVSHPQDVPQPPSDQAEARSGKTFTPLQDRSDAAAAAAAAAQTPNGQEAPASPDPCAAAPLVGPCKGTFSRWYFDRSAGECKHFLYGGCQGNHNNFLQEADCVSECMRKGPDIRTASVAPSGTRATPKVSQSPAESDTRVSKPFLGVGGHPGPESGAVLPLVLGVLITALLLLMISCRMRLVRHKLKKARPLTTEESDYLINGMYL